MKQREILAGLISKYFLVMFFLCSAITAANAQERWDPQFDLEISNGLEIIFDDFPDNSIPHLNFQADNASSDILAKKLDDFFPNDDIEETIKQQSEFALNLYGLPSGIVNGCVNVISGEYQETATDFKLPGVRPLSLRRYYCGSNGKKGCQKHSFLYGWQLNHGAKLFSCQRDIFDSSYAIIKGGNRHGVLFMGLPFDDLYTCPESFFKSCVTNCGLGEIAAKANFKNDELYEGDGVFKLYTADNSCYRFEKSSHDPERRSGSHTHGYRLETLTLSDGVAYKYRYSQTFGMPSAISFIDRKGTTIANLHLKEIPNQYQFQNDPKLTYVTSSGEKR